VGVGGGGQVNKNKEASERQAHPFGKNRRKDGPPTGVLGIEGRPPPSRSLAPWNEAFRKNRA